MDDIILDFDELQKIIKDYEKSDSYKELQRQCTEMKGLLAEYYKKYSKMEQHFKKETVDKKDHERYAKGGLTTHRGVLCPGKVEELLVSNAVKGRFIKSNKSPNYIYAYDKDDRLISSTKLDGKFIETEYITWDNNTTQVGVTYSDNELEHMCLVIYNDKQEIKHCIFGSFLGGKVGQIMSEGYIYKENEVNVTWIDAVCDQIFGDSIRGEHIVLFLDEEGMITKFTNCEDMRQNIVHENIPRSKLSLKNPETIPPVYKTPTTKKKKKANNDVIHIEEIFYQKIKKIIAEWDEDGIYAISFFVESNEANVYEEYCNVTNFFISYNTESFCENAEELSEDRWNYAFWSQDETAIVDTSEDSEEVKLLYRWYEENGILDIGDESGDCYDKDGNYIGKGPNGHYELLTIASHIANRIQMEGILVEKLGKPVPIIVHGLEYTWYDIEATTYANPNGEADTFMKAMEQLGMI